VTASSRGYSDVVSHALAYAAKQFAAAGPLPASVQARPAGLALILARYACDEATIAAAILHEVIALAAPDARDDAARRIGDKFGPVILAIARAAVEPDLTPDGGLRRTWATERVDLLAHLGTLEPRTLSIRAAEEILACGSALADVRRLGREYLPTVATAPGEQLVWWYRAVAEVLDRHEEWPRREMVAELRLLTAELAAEVGG
jgi:hypothetical protein